MDLLNIAIVAFFIALAIGAFLYFRPKAMEGFVTVAVDGELMPKCIARDAEAQQLLAEFQGYKIVSPNSKNGEAYDELKMILQKLLCMDADITGSGAGPYTTYSLPFATQHDIEPVASFVGRCVRNAVRSRDIEVAMDKYEARGIVLIRQLCNDEPTRAVAAKKFHDIVLRVTRNITRACLTEKATLDTPAGPRDPGYFTPDKIMTLHEYSITGGERQYL